MEGNEMRQTQIFIHIRMRRIGLVLSLMMSLILGVVPRVAAVGESVTVPANRVVLTSATGVALGSSFTRGIRASYAGWQES